ncbi:hypothetical protein CRE_24185 [Caenorhabditis remanei]|uniref:Uncharacterized protein n=1 Tax=Caenorhabditis remanei TaxID=31234 RepID=E3N986_CAERE|nr:hypothetical protein CRE_24185 [Caenorhabditis remanei]
MSLDQHQMHAFEEMSTAMLGEMHAKLEKTREMLKEIVGAEENVEMPCSDEPEDLIAAISRIIADKDAEIQYLKDLKTNPGAAIDSKMNAYLSIIQTQLLSQNESVQAEKLKKYKARLQTKNVKIRELRNENKDLNEKLVDGKKKFIDKENKLEADIEKKNNLIQKLATGMQDYMKSTTANRKEFEEDIEELTENLQEAEDEIEKMQVEARERDERLKEAKEQVKKESARIEEMKVELKETKAQLKECLDDMRMMKKEQKEAELKRENKEKEIEDLMYIKYLSKVNDTPPTPQQLPPPSVLSPRQQQCQTNYLSITKEFPDALRLVDISQLVDMIWDGMTMDDLRKTLMRVRKEAEQREAENKGVVSSGY